MRHSLLLVTGIYPPDSGGPAKFAQTFGEWAFQKDIDVTVQTYADLEVSVINNQSIKVCRVRRSKSLMNRYIRMVKGIGTNVAPNTTVLAAGAFLETYIASIIHRFSYVAKVPGDIVWERARNNNLTNLDIEEFQDLNLNIKYRVFRKFYSNSLKRARIVIVPSVGLYNLCQKWGVPREKIRLIYNSVEIPENFSPPLDVHEFDIATICRLAPWKGVDELIEYSAKRNLKLVVVGDGPERDKLENLSKSLGANVTFLGDVSIAVVKHVLSISQVFVLNSYYEGLPHALVEARVAGILSIGRYGTGSEEVINDDIDGYLIRPDRPLDQTLDLALASNNQSIQFVRKAREDARVRFNKECNFSEILKALQGVK